MALLSTLVLSLGALAAAQKFVPPPQGLQAFQSKLFEGAEISYKKVDSPVKRDPGEIERPCADDSPLTDIHLRDHLWRQLLQRLRDSPEAFTPGWQRLGR